MSRSPIITSRLQKAAMDNGFDPVLEPGGDWLVVSALDADARALLGLDRPLRIRGLSDGHRRYLPWHRERVFNATTNWHRNTNPSTRRSMNLKSFTIENYRSITKAYKLALTSSTILIGPNNEGKSNVLRALVLATRLLIGRRRAGATPLVRHVNTHTDVLTYDWSRDFPLHLQKKKPNAESSFILEYELSEPEVEELALLDFVWVKPRPM